MEQYIVSARKYRPGTFASVVGQKALTSTLKNAIASGRLAHSYLFCGSRGVGKTSCARIFAKTINCEHPTADGEACNECASCVAFNQGNSLNIIELDAASNNSVDDIRQLVEQVQIPPSVGRYRVFIVDEVHMLSSAAFNAFLKTLEEPPSYVIFILATTEKHKIIPTILSRCQIYDFNRITVRDMIDHLGYVAKSEGITAEPAALNVIARKADGAMRDALSIFDQVAASTRGNITYRAAIDNLNVLDYNYYNRLLDCFLEGRVLDSWLIYKEIRDAGHDSHFFITGLADYMRDLMVARDPNTITLLEADDDARASMAERGAKCHPEFIYRAMNLCNDADLNYRTASNKQFLIELTLAKICQLSSPSPSNSGEGEGRLKKIAAREKNTVADGGRMQTSDSERMHQGASLQADGDLGRMHQGASLQGADAGSDGGRQGCHRSIASAPKPPIKKIGGKGTFSLSGAGDLGRMHHGASLQGGAGDLGRMHQGAPPQDAGVDSGRMHQGASLHVREGEYTQEQLNAAWQGFMNENPTRHILINTMRASFPVPVGDSPATRHAASLHSDVTDVRTDSYRVMVENEKQRTEMNGAMNEILTYLRDRVGNDRVSIVIELNRGEASPHTWNERKVLEHILEKNPGVRGFIEEFQLTIG